MPMVWTASVGLGKSTNLNSAMAPSSRVLPSAYCSAKISFWDSSIALSAICSSRVLGCFASSTCGKRLHEGPQTDRDENRERERVCQEKHLLRASLSRERARAHEYEGARQKHTSRERDEEALLKKNVKRDVARPARFGCADARVRFQVEFGRLEISLLPFLDGSFGKRGVFLSFSRSLARDWEKVFLKERKTRHRDFLFEHMHAGGADAATYPLAHVGHVVGRGRCGRRRRGRSLQGRHTLRHPAESSRPYPKYVSKGGGAAPVSFGSVAKRDGERAPRTRALLTQHTLSRTREREREREIRAPDSPPPAGEGGCHTLTRESPQRKARALQLTSATTRLGGGAPPSQAARSS